MWLEPERAHPAAELRQERGLCVLRTLAHLGCGQFPHLHPLCFPGGSQSTMRLVLADLERDALIVRSRWSIAPRTARSNVWTITSDGLRFLYAHEAVSTTYPLLDLGRPGTAQEAAAWQARLYIRTVVTRLILEVRQFPLVAFMSIIAADLTSPAPLGAPRTDPDALLSVVWSPAIRQRMEWLPWELPAPDQPLTYAWYVVRDELLALLDAILDLAMCEQTIPVFVCQSATQREHIAARLARSELPAARLTTVELLAEAPLILAPPDRVPADDRSAGDLLQFRRSPWWNGAGTACTFAPTPDEQRWLARVVPSV